MNIFSKCYIAPYVALQNIDFLTTQSSFLIGSSAYSTLLQNSPNLGNMLFTQGALPSDLVVHMTGTPLQLEWKNKQLEADVLLSGKDKLFIDHIINTVKLNMESGKPSVL